MPTRRRFLSIVAGLAGGAVSAPLWSGPPATLHWSGRSMGAAARITVHARGARRTRALLGGVQARLRRLEALFSLWQADSALTGLNRAGGARRLPADLIEVLRLSARVHRCTGGAFDPSVQALWQLYADHFRNAGAAPAPPPAALEAALQRVGFDAVHIGDGSVELGRPGMHLTLNGVAQGYITDAIAEYLREGGIDHMLVDMGELRAVGGNSNGHGWRVGIRDPAAPARLMATLRLRDRALATSAGYGTVFDTGGLHHHLFDPHSGLATHRHASVTVLAASAALADACSTAFACMAVADIRRCCALQPELGALLVDQSGALTAVGA